MKQAWEALREKLTLWFDGLSNRERRLLGILSIALSAALVIIIVYSAIGDVRGKRDKLSKAEEILSDIKRLEGPYRSARMKQELEAQRIRRNDVQLFSLIQMLTARLGLQVKDLVERTTPVPNRKITEISVNLSLTKLSVDKLTALLEAIESSVEGGLVKVTKMKINTRHDEPDLLDLQMTVSTWKVS